MLTYITFKVLAIKMAVATYNEGCVYTHQECSIRVPEGSVERMVCHSTLVQCVDECGVLFHFLELFQIGLIALNGGRVRGQLKSNNKP